MQACNIKDPHSGADEEYSFLGNDTVQTGTQVPINAKGYTKHSDTILFRNVGTYISYLHVVIPQNTGTWTWFMAMSYFCSSGLMKQVKIMDSQIWSPSPDSAPVDLSQLR